MTPKSKVKSEYVLLILMVVGIALLSQYGPALPNPSPSPSGSSSPSPSPTVSPSPTPTATPLSPNLAVAPDDWGDGPYSATHTLLYGLDGRTQIWSMDNTVLYDGKPTMRCGPNADGANAWRELDRWPYVTVKSGDHVVFKAWIKQASSTKGTPTGTVKVGNAAIHFDIWDDTHFIQTVCGPNSFAHPMNPEDYDTGIFCPIGNGWTQVGIDVVMPATVKDVWGTGLQIPFTKIVVMLSGGWGIAVQEQAVAWFADTELYINP